MKGILLLFVAGACLLSSCNKATPRETFEVAVLNCNLMHGFASEGMRSQLASTGTKLAGPNFDHEVEVTRMEVVDTRITSLEAALEKLQKLKPDGGSRDMLQAATALYEFVLPVYRNEYRQLAGLYDSRADPEKIRVLEQSIQDQYQAKYAALSEAMTAAAKPFAEKNNIEVAWDVPDLSFALMPGSDSDCSRPGPGLEIDDVGSSSGHSLRRLQPRNHPIMRALLFLLPVLLPSCGTVVTQDEIFQQAKVELSQREGWSDNAVIVIQQRPDEWHLTWRVSAGSFDYSEPPSASGIRAIPGTERELWFTREGCLLDYSQRESRCLTRYRSVASETWTAPVK